MRYRIICRWSNLPVREREAKRFGPGLSSGVRDGSFSPPQPSRSFATALCLPNGERHVASGWRCREPTGSPPSGISARSESRSRATSRSLCVANCLRVGSGLWPRVGRSSCPPTRKPVKRHDRLADLVAAGVARPPASAHRHGARDRIKSKANVSDLVAEQRR
jgi:hypothetical protein